MRATIDRGANLTGPFLVQDLNYTYDSMGNVVRRHDVTPGFLRDDEARQRGDGHAAGVAPERSAGVS